jgi:hypothetical protein
MTTKNPPEAVKELHEALTKLDAVEPAVEALAKSAAASVNGAEQLARTAREVRRASTGKMAAVRPKEATVPTAAPPEEPGLTGKFNAYR